MNAPIDTDNLRNRRRTMFPALLFKLDSSAQDGDQKIFYSISAEHDC
jgi:hypothetical protein